MQGLSAIDHAEERRKFRRRIGAIGPLDQLGKRSQRQNGWNRGDEHRIRCGEDAFGQQGESCRAVEEDDVVVAAERLEKLRHHAFRLAEITEQAIELAIREVGGKQIQVA